jgi:hypothetical protein
MLPALDMAYGRMVEASPVNRELRHLIFSCPSQAHGAGLQATFSLLKIDSDRA